MSFPFKVVDGMKQCAVDYCSTGLHAIGLCHLHYYRNLHGRPLIGPMPQPFRHGRSKPTPPCVFPDCSNLSMTKKVAGYCMGHYQQVSQGRPLAPLNIKRQGMTKNGRVCKTCQQELPLTEFYKRNRGSISTQCKECFKVDAKYYQGKAEAKSDGTDPKGWQTNPEAMQARAEVVNERAMRPWRERKLKNEDV